jgi:hypothetical protein
MLKASYGVCRSSASCIQEVIRLLPVSPSTNHNKVRFVSTGPSTGEPSITEERARLAALQPRNVTVHSRGQALIRFGVFEANLETGELRKRGFRIKIQEQPFQILAMLLDRRGQVVTRDELHKTLWGAHTFVDFERGLKQGHQPLA